MNLDSLTENDIKGILKCFMKHKNIADLVIEFETGSGMGDGYLGATSIVKVTTGSEVFHLFIKSAPRNETIRSALSTKECFAREIYFYEEVFPILDNIYMKHTKKSLNFFPKCYKTSGEYQKEYMVLDNLKYQGFAILPKNATLSRDHLLMVLEEYAKLHATGFVLKSENPKMFREIHDFIRVDLYNKLMGIVGMNDNVEKNLDFVRPYYDLNKDRDILEKFGKIDEISKDLLHKDKYCDEYATILHTDCWANNLMFKNNKLSETPEDLKIIDYQMPCINSPVFDISSVFYLNAGSEENLKNLDNYLDYYYNTLLANIKELKGDPEKLYPRKIFDEHWRKFRCYGMLLALVLLRQMHAKPEELPNFAEYLEAGRSLFGCFLFPIEKEDEYFYRVNLLLRHCVDNKFI